MWRYTQVKKKEQKFYRNFAVHFSVKFLYSVIGEKNVKNVQKCCGNCAEKWIA